MNNLTREKLKSCGCAIYSINSSKRNTEETELVIAAECVSIYYPNFYQEFVKGKEIDFLCPKQDYSEECINNLTKLINENNITKITIVRINLNCCKFLTNIVKQALINSTKNIPLEEKLINIK